MVLLLNSYFSQYADNADIYLFFVCARLISMFHQGVRILTPWFHLYIASENGNVSKVGGFFASHNIKSLFQELPQLMSREITFPLWLLPKWAGTKTKARLQHFLFDSLERRKKLN